MARLAYTLPLKLLVLKGWVHEIDNAMIASIALQLSSADVDCSLTRDVPNNVD